MAKNGTAYFDREELDRLIGMALVDEDVRGVLLNGGDRTALLHGFRFSQPTEDWLRELHVDSLKQLAEEILCHFSVR